MVRFDCCERCRYSNNVLPHTRHASNHTHAWIPKTPLTFSNFHYTRLKLHHCTLPVHMSLKKYILTKLHSFMTIYWTQKANRLVELLLHIILTSSKGLYCPSHIWGSSSTAKFNLLKPMETSCLNCAGTVHNCLAAIFSTINQMLYLCFSPLSSLTHWSFSSCCDTDCK